MDENTKIKLNNTTLLDFTKSREKIVKCLKDQSKSFDEEIMRKLDLNRILFNVRMIEFGLTLRDKYGYNIRPTIFDAGSGYHRVNDYFAFIEFPKDGRESYHINGYSKEEMPKDVTLLEVSFSTGPYMFYRDAYFTGLFYDFLNEIKSYNPIYTDSLNSKFLFSLEDGAHLYNNFNEIYKKYKSQVSDYVNKKRIKDLEDELNKLKDTGDK